MDRQRDPTSRKVLLLGEPAVGKTSIVKRWTMQQFSTAYTATIAVDFYAKEQSGKLIELWDISGHPEFSSLRTSYYADADAVLFVFDVNMRYTFDSLDLWIRESASFGASNAVLIICGNKIEQDNRQVRKHEGERWAEYRKFKYFEVDAATGYNVTAMFEEIVDKLV